MSATGGAQRATPEPGGAPAGARARARSIALLYFLSGATGLGYEVLWARMLAAQFGLSIFGVAATVAAFLLGLGAGAAWGARAPGGSAGAPAPLDQARRALAAYALLEGAVAVYALCLPQLAALSGPALDAAAAHLAWWQWCTLQGALALFLLGIPAAAIGATFPLALRALAGTGISLGRIYAANTLGAAAGSLLALALLASLGWDAAVRAVAAGGALIGAAALLLSRGLGDSAATQADAQGQSAAVAGAATAAPVPAAPVALASAQRTALLAYAGVGAGAIALEIAWTRLYGMVMLRTEYVLAIILAVYLLGTALGSALAARPRAWMAPAVPLCAAIGALAGLWGLAPFSRWLQAHPFDSLMGALAGQALALALCTLPVTIALGAWLPVLAGRFPAASGQGRFATLLYGANCAGGAAGATVAVVIAIPLLGSAGTVALAAVGFLLLGVALFPSRLLLAALPLVVGAAAWLHTLPAPASLLGAAAVDGRVVYAYEDALSLNHVVEAPDGQRTLLTDLQHLDASSEPAAVAIQEDQARLPLLLHPDPRSVLFLGMGTGISASGSLPWAQLQATAVEISPGAIDAAREWFAPVNAGVTARMRIVHDDARHYLAASNARFDVIVGDLFHPDLAGMGNLLSVEQFQRAREHLGEPGIFTQWLAINQFDRESLRIVLRSFQQVFPDARIYLDGAHLALVGSRGVAPPARAMRASLAAAGAAAGAATGGEGAATWLGRYWGPIAAGVGAVQRESRPVIEFRLPRLRYEDPAPGDGSSRAREASPVAEILLELLRQRPETARAAAQLGVPADERDAFDSAYAASELAVQAWLAVSGGDERRARQLVRLAYEANGRDRWIAASVADDLYESARQDGTLDDAGTIERILRVYPDHVAAVRALWRRERKAERPDAAQALARLRALAPLDNEAATIGVRLP